MFTRQSAVRIQIVGEPVFAPVAGTSLLCYSNTESDLFRHQATGAFYYLVVTLKLPPKHPRSRVSVKQIKAPQVDCQDGNPEFKHTGMTIAWGCAVWGTGWSYPSYVWSGGFYPAHFWYPPTYGFAAWYNPYTGTFGRGAAVYGPCGGAGGFAAYDPRTGTYVRGGAVYGPYGSRGFRGDGFRRRRLRWGFKS